jgi:hypothetical protein
MFQKQVANRDRGREACLEHQVDTLNGTFLSFHSNMFAQKACFLPGSLPNKVPFGRAIQQKTQK